MASVFRWVMLKFSGGPSVMRRWSELVSVSIVDELLWGVVTAFESVALVSMLCFFFVFYGCTI